MLSLIFFSASFVLIPRTFLCLGAGASFGLAAILIILPSTMLGGIMVFLATRYLLSKRFQAYICARPGLRSIVAAVDEEGWRIVALLRFASPVPNAVQNYVFGLTRIGFLPFAVTTFVFSIPQVVLYVYLGSAGRVVLFDDDSFYMGSVLAEVLRTAGNEVTYVTPDDAVALWTAHTQEFRHIQRRLRSIGVSIVTAHNLLGWRDGAAKLACVYSDSTLDVPCDSIMTITSRLPNDELQQALHAREHEWHDAGIEAVTAIGDCLAPGLIAHAVYEGHRCAQELESSTVSEVRFRRHFPVALR